MWRAQVAALVEQLDLKRKPIGVRYVAAAGAPEPDLLDDKMGGCEAFLRASEGHRVWLSAANSTCKLGPYWLGLRGESASEKPKSSPEVEDQREACFIEEVPGAEAADPRGVPPMGDFLLLSPLETTETRPDLVLFICTFEQACKLMALDCHGSKPPGPIEIRGPICYRAVTHPLASRALNVTLMSHAGRRAHGYRADDLLVSVPADRFESMMRTLAELIAAAREVEIPDALRSLFRARCRGTDN